VSSTKEFVGFERIPSGARAGCESRALARREAARAEEPKTGRDSAVDFTKGTLVLCMVIYHSVNYMLGIHVDLKYLSFLPPSFILITGFLIGKVYLAKYRVAGFTVQRRLVVRGVKLLLIFTALNALAAFLIGKNYNGRDLALDDFLDNVGAIYLTGNGRWAVFEILVPISYLLVLSALLVTVCQVGRWFLPALCVGVFILIVSLGRLGLTFETLNLVAVGLLGILFGCIPDRHLESSARFLLLVMVGYIAYLWALTKWHQVYWLQVCGVCLSVALIYMIGQKAWKNVVSRQVMWLGQYSLFAYILQIAMLQALIRIWRRIGLERGGFVLSIVVTSAVILLAVQLLRFLRARSRAADLCYRAAFG